MNRNEERKYMNKAFENTPRHKVKTNNNGFIMALFYTKYNFEKYCMDFDKIENYKKALVDNFKGWHCHHRLEKKYSRDELIKNGLYFNRPPEELVFLTKEEHHQIHAKYNKEKGFAPTKGHHWKLSEKNKEMYSERFKNRIWVNNGIVNKRVFSENIPEGFTVGRIQSWDSSLKGRKWKIDSEGKRYWI